MARRKTKYTLRADGRIEMVKAMPDGKRRHFYGKNDEEVERKYREALAEANAAPKNKTRLFSDVAAEYWERKEKTISPNSVSSYKSKVTELTAEFGDVPVGDITPQLVYDYLQRVALKGYAQCGISDRRSVMKSIIDVALIDGEVKTNPCNGLPTVKGKPKNRRPPATDADVERLEEVKNQSLISKMYYFAEYTGVRIGEASVIQQKHIHAENHKAVVEQNIAFRGQQPEVKPRPKTQAGIREVDLYDNVIEILPQYDDPETFIFFPDGLPMKYEWEKQLRLFREENGIESTPHQFRHTYAGIMHSAEIDVKDISARMGHSSVEITEDVYMNIERAHNEKQRNKANRYIMAERINKQPLTHCHGCGSTYTEAEDGHKFKFCPDCGCLLS